TPQRAEKLNTALPTRVAHVIRTLLAKNPDQRPHSATDVIAALQDLSAPAVQSAKPARFPRWAIATGLLAAAVLVAAVVVIIRDKNGKEVARIEVPEGGKVEITGDKDGKPAPAPTSADPDRKAAESALSVGGVIS